MKRLVTILILLSAISYSQSVNEKQQITKGNDFKPLYTKFNINNISTYIYNNGKADITSGGN